MRSNKALTIIETIDKSLNHHLLKDEHFINYIDDGINSAKLSLDYRQKRELKKLLLFISKESAKAGAVASIEALMQANLIDKS